jgi:hypothetical protein
VIGARFPVKAAYAASFFVKLAELLAAGIRIEEAFVAAIEHVEREGANLWRDVAGFELLRA